MYPILLSEEEQTALINLLDSSIEDLRIEIHESDRSQYKEMLRGQRDTLVQIRHRLHHVPEISDVIAL
jgi:hypothetical protein